MESQGQRTITVSISVRTIFVIIALVALTYLLFRIPHFWLLVLTAVVLATAMDKPVSAMQGRGLPRGISILLIYILLVGLMVIAIAALAPIVAGDARALERELPGYTAWFENVAANLPTSGGGDTTFSLDGLEQQLRNNASTLARSATEIGVAAGAQASRQLRAELETILRHAGQQGARIGVDRHQLDAFGAFHDHAVDDVAAGAADSQHFAIPQRLARQWRGRRVEYRKLDAG